VTDGAKPSGEAVLHYEGREINLPVVEGTEGDVGIDVNRLRAETGMVTLDYGFGNTAASQSALSFVDGAAGELRYRGYPIEELAEQCNFLEVCYLLFYGELPDKSQLEAWTDRVTRHTLLNEEMKPFFDAFPKEAHPMAILSAATSAMSSFYAQHYDPTDPEAIEESAIRLLAKMPTLAAYAYKKSVGQPYVYPRNDVDYSANFLHMMFALPSERYEVHPLVAKALDVLLILHADHGQNASTSTVRMVGSTQANMFASIAAGISALWGPLHGGANSGVVTMLESILESGQTIDTVVARAKDKDDPFRLMGFGHRVYKNYDPRARILKPFADDLLAQLGSTDARVEIARALEEVALSDDYFISRKLYPNVDFYSGLIFGALGFPKRMFTVLFAMGRLPGWISQWKELNSDPTTRIYRPRQIYIGEEKRSVRK
jgi:citrate synthase